MCKQVYHCPLFDFISKVLPAENIFKVEMPAAEGEAFETIPIIQPDHESIFEKDYEEDHDFGDEDEHLKDLMKERGF